VFDPVQLRDRPVLSGIKELGFRLRQLRFRVAKCDRLAVLECTWSPVMRTISAAASPDRRQWGASGFEIKPQWRTGSAIPVEV
jgi:hypothetical protein